MTELMTRSTELSASLTKDIQDVIENFLETAPEERIDRFAHRMIDAGEKSLLADMYKSVLAEQIYLMKVEEDWKFFISPDTNSVYTCWDEFHERLVQVLPISESSSWYYQKVVRYGYEVLKLEKGQFAQVGGLTTVGRMLELTVVDGYNRNDWAKSVRPATELFGDFLKAHHPADTFQEQVADFFFSSAIKHDYQNAGAINPPARELNQLVDELLGRPKIWWEQNGSALVWCIVYPSGEMKRGKLIFDSPLPPPVETNMVKGLRIKDDTGTH